MLPLLLNQNFKNKNEPDKINQRFFEEVLLLLWKKLASLLILAWIHPASVPRLNPPRKVPLWKWGLQNQSRLGFSASSVCIGNLRLPERNCELLMFPSEFLKFWYFPSDIAQTVFGPWLTSVSFKIYTGYK